MSLLHTCTHNRHPPSPCTPTHILPEEATEVIITQQCWVHSLSNGLKARMHLNHIPTSRGHDGLPLSFAQDGHVERPSDGSHVGRLYDDGHVEQPSDDSHVGRLYDDGHVGQPPFSSICTCLQANRMADALLIADLAGRDELMRAQQLYMKKQRSPYMRLVKAIQGNDFVSKFSTHLEGSVVKTVDRQNSFKAVDWQNPSCGQFQYCTADCKWCIHTIGQGLLCQMLMSICRMSGLPAAWWRIHTSCPGLGFSKVSQTNPISSPSQCSGACPPTHDLLSCCRACQGEAPRPMEGDPSSAVQPQQPGRVPGSV